MLSFCDINCSIGRRAAPNPGMFHTTETLGRQMDRFRIERALAWHTASLDHHPIEGNEEISRIAMQHRNIFPLWVVMPHHTGEFPPPEDLVGMMREQGVYAAKLVPQHNVLSYSLESWSCKELFDAFASSSIPVLIDADMMHWDTLCRICTDHPKLQIVLTRVSYRSGRYLYPLLGRFEHLHVEISWYKNFGGIEDICRKFGAERLLFGTDMPFFDPGPVVAMILYADLPGEQKQLVASGNFFRILGVSS